MKSSVNIDAAMIQWNIRAPKPCRWIRGGSAGMRASSASTSAAGRLVCADSSM